MGTLLQLPRHAGDRHEPGGAGAAGQSPLHARGRDLDPGRAPHAAAGAGDRADPAGAELHHAEEEGAGRGARRADEKITPTDAEKPAAFQPNYAEGYTFALLSATGYGLSPILIRLGLENRGLGASLAGGLISYLAATAVMALVLLWPGQWKHVAVEREAAKWFTFSGFMVCVSQMFFYMALAIAPVTVVSPINRLTIVFRLYFSRMLNPQHEVFGGKVILGTVVSLVGAVILSLSTDMVTSLLPLPDAWSRC